MQLLHCRITSTVLALSLFTITLVASSATPAPASAKTNSHSLNNKNTTPTPECAKPPLIYGDLPYEFRIEVVSLKPIDNPFLETFRRGNPVHIDRDYPNGFDQITGFGYDRLTIAFTDQVRDLFRLNNNALIDPDDAFSQLFPDLTNCKSAEFTSSCKQRMATIQILD